MTAELTSTGVPIRQLTFDHHALDYCLIREDRKTLSATVFPSRVLLVKAPREVQDARIDDFLHRKLCWILKQQRYFAQFKIPGKKQYVSGETFRYRGRGYKLLVRRGGAEERVSLRHGVLTVFTTSTGTPSHVKGLLDRWYAERARHVFGERLAVCSGLFDYEETPGLVIRKATRRWGSFSRKTRRIMLNLDLIKVAARYLDYVIIHELCHVAHKNHDGAFYRLMESKLPQWEKLKTELELNLFG